MKYVLDIAALGDIAHKKHRDRLRAEGKAAVHCDHCDHGDNNFVCHHAGSDIHKYWPRHPKGPFTDENAQYCVRHSSEDFDYSSSVPSLELARQIAEEKQRA